MPKAIPGSAKTAPPSSWASRIADRLGGSRSAPWLMALILVLVVTSLYSPSLGFQFILDDHRFTADPRIQNSDHLWDYFTTFVWAQFTGAAPSFYRPVFLIWMRLNYMIGGVSPWGWHLLSIAKHALVAALVGMLAWKLLRDSWSAILAALLF